MMTATEPPLATSNSSLPLPPYWTIPWRVGLTVILAVIMCAAIVGNLLVVVVVLRNRGMRTRTNLFLCNLAVADLLCAVIDMPFSLITVASGSWVFNDVICQLNGFALPFLFVASIHTLMYMSIHKYLSLASPFGRSLTTRCVVAMIVGVWIWAAAAGASTVSPLTRVLYKPAAAQCGPDYPSDAASLAHFGAVVATCYAVPMLVVAVCNSLTFSVIRGYGSRMRRHTTEEWRRVGVQQRRIAVTLLLVVVSFALAWTPWVGYAFYVIFGKSEDAQPPAVINPIIYWCIYFNSACNPVIYALRSEAFLEGYKQVFCTGRGSGSEETSSQNSTMMRNCVDNAQSAEYKSVAILNNVVRFEPGGDDSPWASLDRYGRPRRTRRPPPLVWNLADSDDEEPPVGDAVGSAKDDDVEDRWLSVASVRRDVAEYFETDVPAGRSPASRHTSPTSADTELVDLRQQQHDFVLYKSDDMTAATAMTLPRSPCLDTEMVSGLSVRAGSANDILAGVDATEAATPRRNTKLFSCASTLFGRLLTPSTRTRLTTVSGVDWRRRCDAAKRSQNLWSASMHETSVSVQDHTLVSKQTPVDVGLIVEDTKTEEHDVRVDPSSESENLEASSSRRRSPRPDGSSPASMQLSADEATQQNPTAAAGAVGVCTEDEAVEARRNSKKRPAVRRYPSVERLDLPRRRGIARGEAATASSADGRSLYGADRKSAERFRRQYIDVKLQRRPSPLEQATQSTKTMGSMPSGVDACGKMSANDVRVNAQTLQLPATADAALA